MSEVVDIKSRRTTGVPEKPEKPKVEPDWETLKTLFAAGYTYGQLASLTQFSGGITKQAIFKHAKANAWVKDESHEARLRAKRIMAANDAEIAKASTDPERVLGIDMEPKVDARTAEIMSSEDVIGALATAIATVGQRQKKRANSLHAMWERVRELVNEYLSADDEKRRGEIAATLWGTKTLPIESLVRLTHAHSALQDKERIAFDMQDKDDDKPKIIIPKMARRGTFTETASGDGGTD